MSCVLMYNKCGKATFRSNILLKIAEAMYSVSAHRKILATNFNIGFNKIICTINLHFRVSSSQR